MNTTCAESKDDLVAKINLTNNGYLFSPSAAEVEIATQNRDTFIVTGNRVGGTGFTIRLKP